MSVRQVHHSGLCPRWCRSPPDLPCHPGLSRMYPGSQGPCWGQTISASIGTVWTKSREKKKGRRSHYLCGGPTKSSPGETGLIGRRRCVSWLNLSVPKTKQNCWHRVFILSIIFLLFNKPLLDFKVLSNVFALTEDTVYCKEIDPKPGGGGLLSWTFLCVWVCMDTRYWYTPLSLSHTCTVTHQHTYSPPVVVRFCVLRGASQYQCHNLEGDVYNVGVSDDKDGGHISSLLPPDG